MKVLGRRGEADPLILLPARIFWCAVFTTYVRADQNGPVTFLLRIYSSTFSKSRMIVCTLIFNVQRD
jgi:hypothetical protein